MSLFFGRRPNPEPPPPGVDPADWELCRKLGVTFTPAGSQTDIHVPLEALDARVPWRLRAQPEALSAWMNTIVARLIRVGTALARSQKS